MSETTELNCENCGACCMSVGHPHFIKPQDREIWDSMPSELQEEVNEHVQSLTDIDLGEPCIWLDLQTRRCKNYGFRPTVCREFQLGSDHCYRLRKTI